MITEIIHITLVSITPAVSIDSTIQSPTTFVFPLETTENDLSSEESHHTPETPFEKLIEPQGTFYGEAIGGDFLYSYEAESILWDEYPIMKKGCLSQKSRFIDI
jgi:hypothetical protein